MIHIKNGKSLKTGSTTTHNWAGRKLPSTPPWNWPMLLLMVACSNPRWYMGRRRTGTHPSGCLVFGRYVDLSFWCLTGWRSSQLGLLLGGSALILKSRRRQILTLLACMWFPAQRGDHLGTYTWLPVSLIPCDESCCSPLDFLYLGNLFGGTRVPAAYFSVGRTMAPYALVRADVPEPLKIPYEEVESPVRFGRDVVYKPIPFQVVTDCNAQVLTGVYYIFMVVS